MDTIIRALLVVLLGAIGLTLLAAAGFFLSIHPPRQQSSSTPALFGWTYEEVTLRTTEDLRLAAWLIPRATGAGEHRAVIVLHGYPYSKGNLLGLTPFLHDTYDLLLLDLRYFGDSEGAFTTLGYREWSDVAAAVRFLKGRGYTSVGIWGFSLGAAVALLTLPHEGEIDAVIADSAYADLHEMTLDYYGRLPVIARVLAGITELISRAVLGVAPGDVSPAKAAAAASVPILLIHGANDSTIPLHHHERLRDALHTNSKVQTWVVEGAAHGYTYATARATYEARVLNFLAQHLR